MGFFRLAEIFKTHHTSLVDAEHPRVKVLAVLYGPGVCTIATSIIVDRVKPRWINLDAGLADALIAALSLLSAILFGLSLTVLDKAIDMDTAPPSAGSARDKAAVRLQALSANTLSASIITGCATGIVVAGHVISPVAKIATAVGLGLLVTTGFSGALVIGRIFTETRRRTNRARTSGDNEHEAST